MKSSHRLEWTAVLSFAGRRPLNQSDGADASRRAIGAADCPPRSVRRFARAITRLQRPVVPASTLARLPTADPPLH